MNVQSLVSVGGPPPQAGSSTPAEAVTPKPAPAPEVTTSAPQQEPSREQVKQAVESIRKSVESVASNSLQFSVDDESEIGRAHV